MFGQVTVAVALFPRANMAFVDAHRLGVNRVFLDVRGALFHPFVVVPGVEFVGDDRGGSGGDLRSAGHRVGLLSPVSVRAFDVVLVACAYLDTGNEQLPYARRPEAAHRAPRPVPKVEVPHDLHRLCVRRPHRESHTLYDPERTLVLLNMRTQNVPQALVTAF